MKLPTTFLPIPTKTKNLKPIKYIRLARMTFLVHSGPKKTLAHPPPLKQPPALPPPSHPHTSPKEAPKFTRSHCKRDPGGERKEWGATKKIGLEEVQQLRKHAEEALAPVKEKEEDNKRKDEEARETDDEELANASTAPVAPTADEEMEVETENPVGRGMDAEERIEY
ncbi:hypothetical protein FRC05_011715 [Tulasnella sp. 425]|nr:hypothetical protein FRC05_011715 [Tulasnella sp. 425]